MFNFDLSLFKKCKGICTLRPCFDPFLNRLAILSLQERVVVLAGKVALRLRQQWLCILFLKLSIQYTYKGNESECIMASAPAVWVCHVWQDQCKTHRNKRGARNSLLCVLTVLSTVRTLKYMRFYRLWFMGKVRNLSEAVLTVAHPERTEPLRVSVLGRTY